MEKSKNRKASIAKFFANKRLYIQIASALAVYMLVSHYKISLWWILAAGAATGIIWGKVFCRWMCPIGLFMEFMMKSGSDDSFRNMYQYHKMGCPIAWISGFLNMFSFFRISLNTETCKSCSLCDKACYMPAIDKEKFSLIRKDRTNPAENFSCSKCLKCVSACPNGSLSFKPMIPFVKAR